MKKAKHLLALLLLAAMTVALAACGGDVPPNEVFSADDLPGKTIGVQENTTGDIFASDYEKEGSTVERYSKGNDAIQALIQGKIDCVIIDEEPAKAFVAENEGKLTILETPFEIEDYAIAIKKGNTELLNAVNGALDQLEQDGTLQSIIDNYIGVNAGETPYESPLMSAGKTARWSWRPTPISRPMNTMKRRSRGPGCRRGPGHLRHSGL